ncbi:hypothetical protein M422DRAFT_63517 [Sphaerobolus stellatus SS14]|nr:hypothetical protein M422DRAFT_63517 [Sphaerobolus stellatus SS14]
MLEICMVGFGALGTLYSFILEKSKEVRITAVCRSNYEIMKNQGVDIRSEKYGVFEKYKPARVVYSTTEAADRKYDYVICAAKYVPDLISTTTILGPLISCGSNFVLIQNGIGVHEEIRAAVPKEANVISACAWTDATAIEGGTVVRHGRLDRVVMGIHWPLGEVMIPEEGKMRYNNVVRIVDIMKAGGCDIEATMSIDSMRWQKNLWNIGFSVFCTMARSSCATILSSKSAPVTLPIVRGTMEEAIEIGRANGLTIPETALKYNLDTAVTQFDEEYAKAAATPFTPVHYKPSMLVDLEAGRPIEVQGIVGGVVKVARQLGIPCPRLETAYAVLLLIQEPLLEAARKRLTPP